MDVIRVNGAHVAYRHRPGPRPRPRQGRTIVFANSLKLAKQTLTEMEKGTDE